MPGSFKKNTALGAVPRPIHSDLKSKRIVWETEHPVRWSFMKILRETSSLKQFYPEINPYTEVYQVREGVYALYNDSFDGAGDVWMYLVDGPEKALLVDTSFGVGDLKGLIRHLIGDKELIVVNKRIMSIATATRSLSGYTVTETKFWICRQRTIRISGIICLTIPIS